MRPRRFALGAAREIRRRAGRWLPFVKGAERAVRMPTNLLLQHLLGTTRDPIEITAEEDRARRRPHEAVPSYSRNRWVCLDPPFRPGWLFVALVRDAPDPAHLPSGLDRGLNSMENDAIGRTMLEQSDAR